MNGNPTDLVTSQFDLARVQPRSNLDPELAHGITDAERAAHRPRWSVERRQESITGSIDLTATEARKFHPNQSVMRLEQIVPRSIAKSGGQLCRADDVREKHRGEDTVGVGATSDTRQELLNLVQDRILIPHPGEVILARELNEARTWNPGSDPPSLLDL